MTATATSAQDQNAFITLKYGEFVLRNATISLTPGITPNVMTAAIALQPGVKIPKDADFQFGYGSTVITLKDCRASGGRIHRTGSSREIVFNICDRRWKWGYPANFLIGEYNRRTSDGNVIEGDFKKNASELAQICLDAIGETGYELAGFPTNDYPYFDLNHEPPQLVLDNLCEAYKVKVVLCTDNVIRCYKNGTGDGLPEIPYFESEMSDEVSIKPEKIIVVGGRNLRQRTLDLEPVCYDPASDNGQWLSVDSSEVSYQYHDGWYPGFWDYTYGTPEQKKSRNETVLKCYRLPTSIKDEVTSDGKLLINGWINEIVDREKNGEVRVRRNSYATGSYATENYFTSSSLAYKESADSLVEVGFDLDKDNAMIRFNEPVFIPDSGYMKGASLKLTTCFEAERYSKEFTIDGGVPGTGLKIQREEIFYEYKDGVLKSDTAETADARAQKYVDEYLSGLVEEDSVCKKYGGVLDLSPNGRISEVSWVLSSDGRCETKGLIYINNLETYSEETRRRRRNMEMIRIQNKIDRHSDNVAREKKNKATPAKAANITVARNMPNMRRITCSEEIPPSSFAELVSFNGRVYTLQKPSEDSIPADRLVITPAFIIPADTEAFAMPATTGMLQISFSGDTPAVGDDFGTVANLWSGAKDKTGFKVNGVSGGGVSVSPFNQGYIGATLIDQPKTWYTSYADVTSNQTYYSDWFDMDKTIDIDYLKKVIICEFYLGGGVAEYLKAASTSSVSAGAYLQIEFGRDGNPVYRTDIIAAGGISASCGGGEKLSGGSFGVSGRQTDVSRIEGSYGNGTEFNQMRLKYTHNSSQNFTINVTMNNSIELRGFTFGDF